MSLLYGLTNEQYETLTTLVETSSDPQATLRKMPLSAMQCATVQLRLRLRREKRFARRCYWLLTGLIVGSWICAAVTLLVRSL